MEKSLLFFYGKACSVYYVVDSNVRTSAMKKERILMFQCQQRLRERTTVSRYMYTVYFVALF
jgi:hypothetical protein